MQQISKGPKALTPNDKEYWSTNAAPPRSEIPVITQAQIDDTRRLMASAGTEPMDPTGSTSDCFACGGKDTMLTTNDLVVREATPQGLVTIPRLPGAECTRCQEVLFDTAALNIIDQHLKNAIHGDYLTTVSKSGNVPAILVKEDLRRVLALSGGEKLSWKVIDRDHAYVEVQRS